MGGVEVAHGDVDDKNYVEVQEEVSDAITAIEAKIKFKYSNLSDNCPITPLRLETSWLSLRWLETYARLSSSVIAGRRQRSIDGIQ